MARFFPVPVSGHRRKGFRCNLAFFWLAGLLSGFLTCAYADAAILPLMRGAPYAPLSIIRLLCVSVLPVVLSAFAVFLSNLRFVLLICFAKAFLFAFLSLGICQAFGSAGWLMRLILLFSECLSLPVLYWFWLRGAEDGNRPGFTLSVWIVSLSLLLGSIQACVISPFLACLIEF